MDYKDFTKREMAEIIELVSSSLACATEADVVSVARRLKDLVGADNGVISFGNASKIRRVVDINYPVEWINMYIGGDFQKNDPVIKYNYAFFRPHLWSEALSVFPDEPCRNLMEMATEFGLRYGIAGGVNGEGYKGSIFSFSSSQDRFEERHKKVLDMLIPHVHQALSRVALNPLNKGPSLSVSEIEVLKWMREGKTNWDISLMLKISHSSVKFHVQNIIRKLNAVNKAHAIALAMDNGLAV